MTKTHGSAADVKRLNGIFLLVYAAVSILCVLFGILLVLSAGSIFAKGLTPDQIELTRSLMAIMVVNIIVTLLSTPFDSFIVVHERFVFQQSRQLFTALATPFIALALLYAGSGAVGVAMAQLVVSTLLLVLNIRFAISKLHMRFLFKGLDFAVFKAITIFSFWIFLNQIFDLINNQVPNFLLGAMSSATAVATFAIAVQIRNIFFSMSTTMSNVFVPMINRIVATTDDNHRLTLLMTRVGRYQMILFCYLFGGFTLLGKFFVKVWAGDANSDAYLLALIMTLPVAIPLTQNTGIEIQRAKNKHKTRSLIYILTSVIDIVISVILIPTQGYWATAIGYVASIVLGTGIFMNWYYHSRIGLDMKVFWSKTGFVLLTSSVITAICTATAAFILPVNSFITFILWGGVYSLLFAICSWVLFLTKEERARLQGILKH
jgi:O-antigen/teichoic acid export membrane protein